MNQAVQKADNQYAAKLAEVLRAGVSERIFSGASLQVARHGQTIYTQSVGTVDSESTSGAASEGEATQKVEAAEVDENTVFDMDALTGALITVPIILKYVTQGSIDLDARVSRYVHGFGVYGKSPITVRQVLQHTAGLQPQMPFHTELDKSGRGGRLVSVATRSASQHVYTAINRSELRAKPGVSQLYSELGIILLGHMIETITGVGLDKVAWREICGPLGLTSTSFIDLSLLQRGKYTPDRDRIASSGHCSWRERSLCGEVRDENAWTMGGVAGHAGLFSSVVDLTKWSQFYLSCLRGQNDFLEGALLRDSLRPVEKHENGLRMGFASVRNAIGVDAPSDAPEAVALASKLGTAIYLDPTSATSITFVSNGSVFGRSHKKTASYYPRLFQEIWRTFPR